MENIISDIHNRIEQALKDWGIPGGAAMVWKDGQLLLERGYGVRELGKPEVMDEHTIFHIASSTKAFTAACIGLLVEEGKLGWDDKVVKYLPDFKMYDAWVTQEVTLRDLLNHRLGLKRYNRVMFRNHPFDPDEFLQHMPYMKPFTGFRTRFGYGNEQYIVAGKVIEVVAGKSYEDFLQERIFTPLEMASTYPNLECLKASGAQNICHGHCNLDGGFVPMGVRMFDPVKPLPLVDIGRNAAGCIWSTASDLANWLELFLGNGTFRGKTLFSPQVMEEMRTPQFAIAPRDEDLGAIFTALGVNVNILTYAFGWYVLDYRGRKLVVHGGNIHNGNNAIGFMPQENLAFMVFVNTYQAIAQMLLSFTIVDAMLGLRSDYNQAGIEMAKMWQAGASQAVEGFLKSRKIDTQPSMPLPQYAGVYSSPLLGELCIELQGEALSMVYGNSHAYDARLEHWQDDTFALHYCSGLLDPEFITFAGEADGLPAMAVWMDDRFEEIDRLTRLQSKEKCKSGVTE